MFFGAALVQRCSASRHPNVEGPSCHLLLEVSGLGLLGFRGKGFRERRETQASSKARWAVSVRCALEVGDIR